MGKSWPHWNERQNSCHLNGALVIQSPCSQKLLYGLTPSFFTWWIVPCPRHRGAPAPSVWTEHGQGGGGLKQDAPLSQPLSVQLPSIVPEQATRLGAWWGFFFRNYRAWTKLFAVCKLSGLAKCSVRAGLHITTWGWCPASSNEALAHCYLRWVAETNSQWSVEKLLPFTCRI